jgi:single-strand DNA-binding protein
MNRIVIVGRLGSDPELRQSRSGTAWCSMTIATNRARKEGDQWVEETDWHEVKVFGDDAERSHRKLRKGSVVAVDGSLVYETWKDDAGNRRRKPKIVATRVQFLADLREAPAASEPETDATTLDATVL